jgi:hypothetical protein
LIKGDRVPECPYKISPVVDDDSGMLDMSSDEADVDDDDDMVRRCFVTASVVVPQQRAAGCLGATVAAVTGWAMTPGTPSGGGSSGHNCCRPKKPAATVRHCHAARQPIISSAAGAVVAVTLMVDKRQRLREEKCDLVANVTHGYQQTRLSPRFREHIYVTYASVLP